MQLENVENVYPLSPMHEGMLFHTISDPTSGVFVEQISCSLTGQLNVADFKRAWDGVVARHASLRTIFLWDGLDEPLQVVRSEVTIPWQELDWSTATESEQHQLLSDFHSSDRCRGIDLADAPLMRMTIIQLADSTWRFIWTFHHLLSDGWSTPLVLEEVFHNYLSLGQGQPIKTEASFEYGKYIEYLQSRSLGEAERFWREKLAGFAEPIRITDYFTRVNSCQEKANRDAKLSHSQRTYRLSASTSKRIKDFAKAHRLTLNTVILGAWARLLHAHTRVADIVFGTTVSGRPAELVGVEAAIGLFINTLPLRVSLSGEQSLVSWLSDIQHQQVTMRQFEFSPLARVQRWSDIPRGESLFETIVVFENYPESSSVALDDVGVQADDFAYVEQSNYALALLVVPQEEIELHLVHELDRFSVEFVESALKQLENILTSFVDAPHLEAPRHSVTTEDERKQLLQLASGDSIHVEPTNMYARIQLHAQAQPNTVAVVFENQQTTYAQLISRSRALATQLQTKGVRVGDFVGLFVERGPNLIVGILGILGAGAAYVPLDPEYPDGRLKQIILDANLAHIVTQTDLVDAVPKNIANLTTVDSSVQHNAACAASEALPVERANFNWESPAYVIYTSGSQGQPKGVPVSHRNLMYSTQARRHFYKKPVGSFLLLSSFAFDSSIAGIFWTLIDGGTLVLPKKRLEQDIDRLSELIEREAVTHTLCLPTLYEVLLEHKPNAKLPPLTHVIVAGEACPQRLVQLHHEKCPQAKLFNEYGPTEGTVWCTAAELSAHHSGSDVSIGRPIANTSAYVLDEQNAPVPAGMCGELCIAGAGVTDGYLHKPEQTSAQFIDNPMPNEPHTFNGKLYRTGDLVYATPVGNLAYVARVDEQVKIRGYRIELSEIESAIMQDAEIASAVVVAQPLSSPRKADVEVTTTELKKLADQFDSSIVQRLLGELLELSDDDISQLLEESA